MNANNNLIKWLTIFNTVAILAIGAMVGYNTFSDKKPAQPNRPQPPMAKNINMAPLIQGAQTMGSDKARVNIVVFNSFTCGFCKKSKDVLHTVVNKYPDKVRLVYRHFNRNEVDIKAGVAAECAGEQNKFWQMYDEIFAGETGNQNFTGYAQKIGLNAGQFNQCLNSGKYEAKINADTEMGRKLGINGTPSFVINGEMTVGYRPIDVFESAVKKYF